MKYIPTNIKVVMRFELAITIFLASIFSFSCNKTDNYHSILNYHSDEQIASMTSKELKKYELELSNAVSYFENKSLDEYTMLALVKKGKVQMSSKQFLNALVSFKSSLSYAEKISDTHLEAEIYRLMASIYRFCFEPTEAIKCLKKSELIFSETHDTLSRYNVLMDIGSIYLDLQEYSKSEKYFNKVILWAKSNQDYTLLGRSMTEYARTLIKKSHPNPRLAINLMEDAESRYGIELTVDDRSTLAYAYNLVGDYKRADRIMQQTEKSVNDVTTRLIYSYWQYRINEDKQNPAEYRKWQEITDSLCTLLLDEALQESLQSAEVEYYKTQSENKEQQLTSQKGKIIIVLVTFIPILIICIIAIMIFIHHNRGKIIKYKKSLVSLAENNKILIENKDEYYRKVRKGEMVVILNEMIEVYYERKHDTGVKNAIFLLLETFINNTRNKKTTLIEMENIVNLLSDNIILKLKKECPSLKTTDYTLFILLAMGFSFVSIGVLMSLEPDQVYRQKYRLKQKIKSSNTQNRELFLSVLS